MDRGQSDAALAWYDQAIAAMKNLLAREPRHVLAPGLLLQALGGRASTLIGLGRLKELEQTYKDLEKRYQEAIELDPSHHSNWFYDAPLRLQRGDVEGYRRVCREMLARFSQTDDPLIAEQTAKTCLLRADAVSDLGPVLQLANRAVTGTEQRGGYRWLLLTKGMADYRAGDFANAIDRLNKTLSLVDDTRYQERWVRDNERALAGTAHVFLAMAHHQQGHAIEARQELDQATQLMEQMDQNKTPRPDWDNWLRFCLVYGEAEQLVRRKAEAPK